MNVSFSGCGFLAIYHVGVATAIKEYAPDLIAGKISGTSGGALAATALVCDYCLGQATSDVLKVATELRSNTLGALHPSVNLTNILRKLLRKTLPNDAHKSATGRLFISLTRLPDGENFLVSEFDSRDELIEALLCSAFIPVYSGTVPPSYRGMRCIDGGFSNSLPVLDEHTITVSPFSGESDICPADRFSSSDMCFDFQNVNIRFTCQNLYRLGVALFPPHPEIMSEMCRQGFEDGLRFLAKHELISCKRCVAVRSSAWLFDDDDDDDVRTHARRKTPVKPASPSNRSPVRVLPKMISTVDMDRQSKPCKKCKEAVNHAAARGLPQIIKNTLRKGEELEKTILAYVLRSKTVQLMRWLLFPSLLPFHMTYTTATKLLETVPSICRFGTQLYSHLVKSIDMFSQDYVAKLTCQLAVTEVEYHGLSADIASAFSSYPQGMLHPTNVHPSHSAASLKDEYHNVKELKLGFSVDFSHSRNSFRRVASSIKHDTSNAADVCHAVDELELATLQKTSKIDQTTQVSSEELRNLDEIHSVLEYTANHEAMMAFYYLDENNRVKITEIYDVDDEHGEKLFA